MKIIEEKKKVFILNTRNTSYLFRVDRFKHLEHIYYGQSVLIEDAEALAVKRKIGYGDTIVYDEKDPVYCLDNVPLEYGTYGTGDFREASLLIKDDDSFSSDFLYDSYQIINGDVSIKGLPSAYGADKTLCIHLKDHKRKINLDLYYAIYPETDVISRRAVLINNSGHDITIDKIMSYCLDLYEQDLTMMSFHGAWDQETHLNERSLKKGTYTIGSRVGFSSSKNNPGFIIRKDHTDEDTGKAWGFNLVYSGNHYASVSVDEYGIHRIQAGISPERFSLILKDSGSFMTPQAIMTFSDQGLNRLSQNFHAFINEHIIRSAWKNKERPILINSWEGFGFNFHKDDLINKLAVNAKDLGIELFVLDDGWFGRRDNDTKGLGDYDCNLDKIPGGIASLSKEIHKMGMKFGIWVEPEAISIDSALYEKHPEYALIEKDRGPYFGRHELLMDLSNPEVRDYIVDNVSRLIDENKVDYIKWDMNRMMNGVDGVYNHQYIIGLYEVLDRIFTPRPEVLFESCSSGGNRFDLGILCYSPQVWSSDNTDPLERLDIQKGLSYLYPLSTMGAHVSAVPHSQTLRKTPLQTRFAVSAYGLLGYELDLSKLSSFEKEEIRKQIAYYKKHRRTFQYGTFYRMAKGQDGFEVLGEKEAIVSLFRRLMPAVPLNDTLTVKGLKDKAMYTVSSRPYSLLLSDFGHLTAYLGNLPIESIEAARQRYKASGAALHNGIALDPLYLGTGFDPALRIPLDFGSDMYEIKESRK